MVSQRLLVATRPPTQPTPHGNTSVQTAPQHRCRSAKGSQSAMLTAPTLVGDSKPMRGSDSSADTSRSPRFCACGTQSDIMSALHMSYVTRVRKC